MFCTEIKHFTDDKTFPGPDHGFAEDGDYINRMVQDILLMENILGRPIKMVHPEEGGSTYQHETGNTAATNLRSGDITSREDLELLRPCEEDTLKADQLSAVVGKKPVANVLKGQGLTEKHIG